MIPFLAGGCLDCMPYADPAAWKKSHAARYAAIYQGDPDFRDAESARKAAWYALWASDPAWLAMQAEKKRLQRAAKKKITKK